jgi:hypothetical protein
LPVVANRLLFEAMPLFSRGYLLGQREVAKNSGFNKIMGDPNGRSGVNPKFLATARLGGIPS